VGEAQERQECGVVKEGYGSQGKNGCAGAVRGGREVFRSYPGGRVLRAGWDRRDYGLVLEGTVGS
jgi:hypothetical protein